VAWMRERWGARNLLSEGDGVYAVRE
jgi:hypothetical protein